VREHHLREGNTRLFGLDQLPKVFKKKKKFTLAIHSETVCVFSSHENPERLRLQPCIPRNVAGAAENYGEVKSGGTSLVHTLVLPRRTHTQVVKRNLGSCRTENAKRKDVRIEALASFESLVGSSPTRTLQDSRRDTSAQTDITQRDGISRRRNQSVLEKHKQRFLRKEKAASRHILFIRNSISLNNYT